MPTEAVIFLAFIVIAFGCFAATLAYVDSSTKQARRQHHPIPGE
ncbi:hypothetical protein [Ancylobacter moscoviensis]